MRKSTLTPLFSHPSASTSLPPSALPKAHHTPPLPSLSPWMDSVRCGCVLRAEGGSPPPCLPPPPHTRRLSAVISRLESHQPAQQLWLPAASPVALTGEKAARGAGGEAAPISASSHVVGFKVPLRQALSQVYIEAHTHTLVGIHLSEVQISGQFSPLGRISLLFDRVF